MAYKNKEDARAYIRKHYMENKEYYRDKNKRKKEELKEFIKAQKAKPCTDCGVQYPHYVMDFDHLSDKKYAIAHMSSTSKNKILEEIAKCELVCANCHRERTHCRGVKDSTSRF